MAENDVFSALNIGSGLNTTELIKNLIDAERIPQEDKLNKKIETAEVSVSAIAELKNLVQTSNTVIKGLNGTEVFSGSSTSTAVILSVDDPAKVKEMLSTVAVSKLAKGQTLVFDGFTSATQSLGSGDLIFQRGTWSDGSFTSDITYNPKTVTIGNTSYTITDIKDAINTANIGATASVVKKSTTDFALVIRANSGASNSFQLSITEGSNAGLKSIEHKSQTTNTSSISSSAGATLTSSAAHGFKVGDTVKYVASGTALTGLTALSTYTIATVPSSTSFTLTSSNGSTITYGGANGSSGDTFVRNSDETVAGQDASFTVDGVVVTRPSNTITDVIDGSTLTLKTTTTTDALVSISTSKDKVLKALESLIAEVNNITSSISELTARGLNGEEKGALAGDTTMRTLSQRLKKITTQPMEGYGAKAIYLANLGVSTTQDGTMVLNERTFDDAFASNPQSLTALFTDRLHSESSLVIPKIAGSNYKAGKYYFDLGTRGVLTGTSVSTDITSSNYTPASGSQNLQLTVNGKQSGTIAISGGPYSTTATMAAALETAINSNNVLAGAAISVDVEYVSNKYIITSNKYGTESSVVLNSIDSGLENYLGMTSGTSSSGTGYSEGASLTGTALEQTATGFRTTSGDALGLSIKVTAPGKSTYISIGNSFMTGLSDYLSEILTTKGTLSSRTAGLNKEISGYNDDLVDLEEEIEKSTQRYKEQYGAMESTVNSFKSTGDYLTNYMDAQNSD